MFLVVGPSGVGKDSLILAARPRLLAEGFTFPRRWITAPADRGEDHIPVSCADFEEALARGFLDMHWAAHGLRYGVPAGVRDDLGAGFHVVANVSRSVIGEARARFPRLRIVHVTAPANIVRERLSQRSRESAAEIQMRLQRPAALAPDGHDVVLFANDLPLLESAVRFAAAVIAARCP